MHTADHNVVERFAERTLLIVWPTKNETWAASTIKLYHEAGGACVVYVGERPGGRTGDDVFHALLGELTTCVQCEYGSMTSPCICGIDVMWWRTESIALPHWPGHDDALYVYTALMGTPTGGRTSSRPRRSAARS